MRSTARSGCVTTHGWRSSPSFAGLHSSAREGSTVSCTSPGRRSGCRSTWRPPDGGSPTSLRSGPTMTPRGPTRGPAVTFLSRPTAFSPHACAARGGSWAGASVPPLFERWWRPRRGSPPRWSGGGCPLRLWRRSWLSWTATETDLPRLVEVEVAAGQLFHTVGMSFVAADVPQIDDLRKAVLADRIWVAGVGAQVAGYISAEVVDGNAHIAQVSVASTRLRCQTSMLPSGAR